MEENNFIITEENEKDWKIRFLEYVKHYFNIWKKRKDSSSNKSLEDELLEQATSDEEKQVLKELFSDIDGYHAEMSNLMEAMRKDNNLTSGEWLEQQIFESVDNLAREISSDGRELNEEEKASLRNQIRDAMDKELETEVDELGKLEDVISDLESKKGGR